MNGMRKAGEWVRDFFSNEAHGWILLGLGILYCGIAATLTRVQLQTGQKPDVELLKEVGGTLLLWGSIVAGGATAKKMTATIKGNGSAPAAPAPEPVPPAGAAAGG
jgi:hypothetical protein